MRRSVGVRLVHWLLLVAGALGAAGLGLALAPQLWNAAGFASGVAMLLAAKAATFELFRLHRCSWRWFGATDAAALTVANTSGSVLAALALGPSGFESFPFALLLIDWFVSEGFLLGSGLGWRLVSQAIEARASNRPRQRALIYDAGREGVSLLRDLRESPAGYAVLGFIDDAPERRHLLIQMTPVLGNSGELPRLARLHDAELLLVARPPSDKQGRDHLLAMASFARLPCGFARREIRRGKNLRARKESRQPSRADRVARAE